MIETTILKPEHRISERLTVPHHTPMLFLHPDFQGGQLSSAGDLLLWGYLEEWVFSSFSFGSKISS